MYLLIIFMLLDNEVWTVRYDSYSDCNDAREIVALWPDKPPTECQTIEYSPAF